MFRKLYVESSIIPKLKTNFEVDLFNTFRSYIDFIDLPQQLYLNNDNRGFLFEIVKEMTGGQVFFSLTKPGIIRGQHFHMRKIERFCVVSGNAIIRLRKIGGTKIHEYKVTGDNPVAIDIPVYYTHNIKNIGKSNLLTLFWFLLTSFDVPTENPSTPKAVKLFASVPSASALSEARYFVVPLHTSNHL